MADNPLNLIMDINTATPEAIADALIHVQDRIKNYTELKDKLSQRLTTHLELGNISNQFDFDEYHFTFSPGRKTYDYPQHIAELEAQLLEAKEAAVSTGMATERRGKPFWTVRNAHAPSRTAK